MTLRVDQREIQLSWVAPPVSPGRCIMASYTGRKKMVCYYNRVDFILLLNDQLYQSYPAASVDAVKVCDVKTLPKVATTSISSWGAFITLLARRRFLFKY